MSDHAKWYAPSAGDQWFNCPASPGMVEMLPDDSSPEARLGTAAHELLNYCLRNKAEPVSFLGNELVEIIEDDGEITRIIVDENMVRGVTLATNYVKQMELVSGKSAYEARVGLPHIDPDLWGTLDVYHEGIDGVMTVPDFKNGRVDVSIMQNVQLWIYALAAYYTLCTMRQHIKWVRLVIFQPNGIMPGPMIKQDVFPISALLEFEKVLTLAVGRTKAPDAPTTVGDHCVYCRARFLCAAKREPYAHVGRLLKTLDVERAPLSDLAFLLDHQKQITKLYEHLEAAACKRLIAGEKTDQLKLVTPIKHKKFINEDKAAKELLAAFGVDALRPKTPGELRKLGKEQRAYAQQNAQTPPVTKPAVALPGDKRSPFTRRTPQQMFGE